MHTFSSRCMGSKDADTYTDAAGVAQAPDERRMKAYVSVLWCFRYVIPFLTHPSSSCPRTREKLISHSQLLALQATITHGCSTLAWDWTRLG